MLGKLSGVAVQIQKLQTLAYYLYCHTHWLSLSVEYVTKSIKILRDRSLAGKIIILIKYSPKPENLLGKLKDQIECNSEEAVNTDAIAKLSETRWTVQAGCFSRILDNYDALVAVWKHYLQNNQLNTDVKSRIIGAKKQMKTFELILRLNIEHRLFSHTDNLSNTLQGEKMSANNSKRTSELVASVIQGMRNERSFNQMFDAITTKAKAQTFVNDEVLSRKIKEPNYSIPQ